MLTFKLVAKIAFLASLASSSTLPHTKRTDSATGEVAVVASNEVTADIGILNFALTLEHLEHQFYIESLHRFGEQDFRRTNIPNPTQSFQNFHHILQHEAQHVKTLQAVITSLGGTPLPPCEYNFGVEDVHGFMALARILEKVGVSAYDGAVALLNNADLQTAAATIDTVEARHVSFIATATGVDPFPEDFDVALSGDQIVTLAASVIKKCPFDIKGTLGAAPAGTLSLVAPHVVRAGREIKVRFDPGQNKPEDHFCSFMFSDKSVLSPLSSDFKCKVPRGCRGDIFVAILNKNEPLNLKNSVAIIAAGPIIVNVDSSIEDSCKKFVHGVEFDWKGYDIKHDKAYDVDVEKKKDDHLGVDYEPKVDTNGSNDHSKVDASRDHSEMDASKGSHQTEVTSESKDPEPSKCEYAASYRKRELYESSSRAELPLWNMTPNPVEQPPTSADASGMQEVHDAEADSADVPSDESNGDYDAIASESHGAENAHMDGNEMENEFVDDSDMEGDDGKSGGAELSGEDDVPVVYGWPEEMVPLPATVALAEAQGTAASSLTPTPTPGFIDDVINALRIEVARAVADQSSDDAETLGVPEPQEDSIDGSDVDAPNFDLEADDSELSPQSKTDSRDARQIAAELEAQLQAIASQSQRKA